jgi:hypothetical protein
MLNRIPVYLALILCVSVSFSLFMIKDNVMLLRAELSQVKKQIQYEQDTIHILKAELSYLTSPERLRVLADHYSSLKSIKVTQMIVDPVARGQNEPSMQSRERKTFAGEVKWRYKKGPTQYITTVSSKR